MKDPHKKGRKLPTLGEQKSDPERMETGKSVSKPKRVPPEDNTRRQAAEPPARRRLVLTPGAASRAHPWARCA